MVYKKTSRKGTKKTSRKGTKKRVMKKSKGLRKNKMRRSKKGGKGGLDMTNPPRIGDCVKKGMTGIRTYKVVEVKGSNGFGMPTIVVEGSDGQQERHNLRDMVKCNIKGGRHTRKH